MSKITRMVLTIAFAALCIGTIAAQSRPARILPWRQPAVIGVPRPTGIFGVPRLPGASPIFPSTVGPLRVAPTVSTLGLSILPRPRAATIGQMAEQQRVEAAQTQFRMELARAVADADRRRQRQNHESFRARAGLNGPFPLSLPPSPSPLSIMLGNTNIAGQALPVTQAVAAPTEETITPLTVAGTDGDVTILTDGQGHYYRVARTKARPRRR